MPKSVLISGASSGIGRALCMELDRQGYQVFAGVRSPEDAEMLRSESSVQLHPVILDITQPEQIAAACKTISDQTDGELFCLVNNAGIDVGGALEFLPLEDFRMQLEVNVIGQLALTQACLPMLRKTSGRIIFVSSIGGRLITPFNGPYGASKAALVAVADALRLELSPWNIYVSVLIVGSVKTPIWEKSSHMAGEILHREPPQAKELYAKLQKRAGVIYLHAGRKGMPVERAALFARQVVEAKRPKEYILVGSDARLLELIARFYPVRLRDWAVLYQLGFMKK